MKVSVAERRKAARVPVDFDVRYKVLRGKEMRENRGYMEVKAKNISQYGICILTPEELQEGDILHINFRVEDREIDAFSAVIWSDELKDDYEAGLEFDFLSHYDAIFLIQYMKKTLENA